MFLQDVSCFCSSIKMDCTCIEIFLKFKQIFAEFWCTKVVSDSAATHYSSSVSSQKDQECSAPFKCFQCIGRQWDEYRRTRSGAPVCVVQSFPPHQRYTRGSWRSQESRAYCITRSNMSCKSVTHAEICMFDVLNASPCNWPMSLSHIVLKKFEQSLQSFIVINWSRAFLFFAFKYIFNNHGLLHLKSWMGDLWVVP